jgi:hypothetical protein
LNDLVGCVEFAHQLYNVLRLKVEDEDNDMKSAINKLEETILAT